MNQVPGWACLDRDSVRSDGSGTGGHPGSHKGNGISGLPYFSGYDGSGRTPETYVELRVGDLLLGFDLL
jgi:hypothetical protein